MERKKKYTAPAVLEEFHLETEVRILTQSVVQDDTEIESIGQEVEIHIDPTDPNDFGWEQRWE